jgi:hypothetical protein
MMLIKEGYYKDTDFELAIFHVRENDIVPYKLPLLEKEALYLMESSKNLKEEKREDLLLDSD